MSLFSTAAPARPGFPAPGVAFSILSESASHRAELAALELGEARDHALVSVLLAAGTAALGLITGLAVTLLLASLVWESPHRIAWMVGICAGYLTLTAGFAFALVLRLRSWRPLGEIQSQLQEDIQCLGKLIKSAIP